MWAALPKKLSEALSKTHNALQMAKQLRKTHAARLSQSDVTPIARSSFTVPEIKNWGHTRSPSLRRAGLGVQSSFAAGAVRSASSTAVFAGSVAGVRSMFIDASVGPVLWKSALVIAGMNTVGFAITAITKSHKITDLTGTTAFIGSVWATHALHCQAVGLSLLQPSKSLLLTGMVTLWGARLAGFLFSRVLQVGKDARLESFFPSDKDEPFLTGQSLFPLKLAGFWTTQGLWAWLVCLPVTVAHASTAAGGVMGPVAWVGAGAWAVGFCWETIADQQKSRFKSNPENKGKASKHLKDVFPKLRFIDSGLYALSRYPNYFGEILAWSGLYLTAAFPSLWLQYPWIAVSPAFTAVLLLFVSGVPLTEESQQKRYGSDPKFQEYKATTNLLIPGPKHGTKNH